MTTECAKWCGSGRAQARPIGAFGYFYADDMLASDNPPIYCSKQCATAGKPLHPVSKPPGESPKGWVPTDAWPGSEIAALRRDLAEARTALASKEAEMRAWEVDIRQLSARLAVTVGALERIAGDKVGAVLNWWQCREVARAALAPTGAPAAKETT